jgi:hypothetical protein
MTTTKQCCGNCRFFTWWDRTPYGEDCPAWEKGTPKVSPTKFSKTKTKTKK